MSAYNGIINKVLRIQQLSIDCDLLNFSNITYYDMKWMHYMSLNNNQ